MLGGVKEKGEDFCPRPFRMVFCCEHVSVA